MITLIAKGGCHAPTGESPEIEKPGTQQKSYLRVLKTPEIIVLPGDSLGGFFVGEGDMNKTKEGYNHAEAFHLMKYHCESCGISEILWNSRDGVTPFIIDCTHCHGKDGAKHVNWDHDKCSPEYSPGPGMRVFVDLTLKKAIECSVKRVEMMKKFEDGQFYYDVRDFDNIERFVSLVMDTYHQGEAPNIITGVEYEINRLRKEAGLIKSQKFIDKINQQTKSQ